MGEFQNAFQDAYLDRELLDKTAGAPGDRSPNNVKPREMENSFMNFVSETAARDVVFI